MASHLLMGVLLAQAIALLIHGRCTAPTSEAAVDALPAGVRKLVDQLDADERADFFANYAAARSSVDDRPLVVGT